MNIDNPFLKIALHQASRLAGKPGRILKLVLLLGPRLGNIRREDLSIAALKEKLSLIGRLISAHVKGHYRVSSMKLLVMLLAALVYFLNPFDLIPDFIVGIGLTDDLAVLTWIYAATGKEVAAYAQWEQTQDVIISDAA